MSFFDQDLVSIKAFMAAADYAAAEDLLAKHNNVNMLSPPQNTERLFALALCREGVDDYDGAREYYNMAYHSGVVRGKREAETAALHRLGLLEARRGQTQEAIRYFRLELSLYHSRMDDYYSLLSANYLAQGDCFAVLEDFQEARMYYKHAFTFATTEFNHLAEARALEATAKLYLMQNKKKDALRYYRRALETFKLAAIPEEIKRLQKPMEDLRASLSVQQMQGKAQTQLVFRRINQESLKTITPTAEDSLENSAKID